MSYGDRFDKRKARKIAEYMEEYRQLSTELPDPSKGGEPRDSGPVPSRPEKADPAGGTSLLEKISHQERDFFDPFGVSEHSPGPASSEEEPDWHNQGLYGAAVGAVREAIRLVEKGQLPALDGMQSLVEEISDDIAGDSQLLMLSTVRTQPFAVSTHCVNVAIYALRISRELKHRREQQIRVGLAGLLHEVGVVRLKQRAVYQEGRVDPEVRRRPVHSAEILSGLGTPYQWLVETVSQVYEREDGSGCPLGLGGDDIREEAKILAISDVVDACIHERPYREPLTGYQLFYELTTGRTRGFSDQVVKAALKSFSLYPYNEYVVLSTGEVGRVIEINPKNLLRPRISVLYSSEGEVLEIPRDVDLAQHPSTNITEAIPYQSLLE